VGAVRRGDQGRALPGTRKATFTAPACAIIDGMESELGACLRTWRDRVAPADAGLPAGGMRRAPGLRREEVAYLAGLSVDYLARLEQGRALHPSASVLAPLARALRLNDEERAHLYRLAGHAEPDAGRIRRHVTPSVQRVLDRLADVPVMVVDAAWQLVAVNPLAAALHGDVTGEPPRARNIAWRHLMRHPSRIARDPDEIARTDAEIVADLRAALGRFPDDEPLRALIADLRRECPRFVELWEARPLGQRTSSRKTILHPEVGPVTLDCDVLSVAGSDLRLVVYTAAPGSPDGQALALLGAVGLQSFVIGRSSGG
jgi:transcriptional regulator with XRE-family HTH domain